MKGDEFFVENYPEFPQIIAVWQKVFPTYLKNRKEKDVIASDLDSWMAFLKLWSENPQA